MNKTWLVAKHEFLSNIKRRSFLLAVFGIPALTLVLLVVVMLVTANVTGSGEIAEGTIGYVDQSDILAEAIDRPENLVAYDSIDAADVALENDEIAAYFVLPRTYMQIGNVQLYAKGTVSEDLQDTIDDYIESNLVAQIDSDAPRERLLDPVNMTIVLENSGRTLEQEGILGLIIVPVAFTFVLFMAIQLTSTFLMSGVVEEKTNRIIEVLITTITPRQLLTGKLLGLAGLGFFQLAVWLTVGAIALVVGQQAPFLANVVIPLDMVVIALVYFLLTYLMYASLLAAIGAISNSEQESNSIAGFLTMPIVIPFILFVQFLSSPNGSIPTILSLIPFTAAPSMIMRVSFATVPVEQILLSFGILLLTGSLFLWLGARLFRWGLLMYGKKVTPGMLLRVLRRDPEMGVLPTTTTSSEVKA